ncbi:MAG: hypothetical protein M3Q07_28305, partial [Pseudobdellovibrionaceae bacterium]|nr:hypothetical protein [Pseudobdellovibrionaceae bacterium]
FPKELASLFSNKWLRQYVMIGGGLIVEKGKNVSSYIYLVEEDNKPIEILECDHLIRHEDISIQEIIARSPFGTWTGQDILGNKEIVLSYRPNVKFGVVLSEKAVYQARQYFAKDYGIALDRVVIWNPKVNLKKKPIVEDTKDSSTPTIELLVEDKSRTLRRHRVDPRFTET